MRKKAASRLVLGLSMLVSGLVVGARRAEADTVDPTTYTYTGNLFTTFNGTLPSGVSSITGSFTLTSPLGANFGTPGVGGLVSPLSFSFTDGATTLTQFNSDAGFFITTDAAGAIAAWGIDVVGLSGVPDIRTQNGCIQAACHTEDETIYLFGVNQAFNGNPGTWSSSGAAVVPEPSSLILLGSGLLGLAPLLRRRFAHPRRA